MTDLEVAVIRNLQARDPKPSNQKILGWLNAARRAEGLDDVNNGRITDVKNNEPRFNGIVAASDHDTEQFLEKAKLPPLIVSASPIAAAILKSTFKPDPSDKDRLIVTETDFIECKESFGGGWNNCIKAIAAFSNNRGGYILFGVKDKTWEIVGINGTKFAALDRKDVNQNLRSCLSSGIDFETTVLKQSGKSIGVMYVHPAKMKPVMFIKQVNEASAAEGHIYYRYHGENRLIGPMELQAIVEERIKALSQTVLSKHLQNIIKNGIENSAVLNLQSGEVDGKAGAFLIDEAILPKISFIKEGEFVEISGAPTLKLIGDVTKTASIIGMKLEDLTKAYPLTWKDLVRAIKKAKSGIKDGQINAVIASKSMKTNREFSAFVFRSKSQADNYEVSKIVPAGIPSIYNNRAVEFICDNLETKLHQGANLK